MERISWTDRVRNEELLSQERQKYPTYNKREEEEPYWSHPAWELPSKPRYKRNDGGKDGSDRKTRKKT